MMYESPFLEDVEPSIWDKLKGEGLDGALSFCFYSSPYIARTLISHQDWIEEIFVNKDYQKSLDREDYIGMFSSLSLAEIKNLFRKEHVRLGIRDLLRAAEVDRILRELSFLADGVISSLLQMSVSETSQSIGIPPEQFECCVVALGKLGGEELNYYSDVDLMYVYSRSETGKLGSKTDLEVYTRVFSRLNRFLSDYSEGGPIYHVDLRLRPQGRKGLLCMPVDAYEAYYESFGRTWERAMLLRARLCAGSKELYEELERRIEPFVYRKALDYSVVEELKFLKDSIDRESKHQDRNIKTGKGGIREIEFIVQSFQLVFSGQNPWLRTGNVFLALNRLKAAGLMGAEEYSILTQAYRFYRRLENRIQMLNCSQTQLLPEKGEDLKRICVSMGYGDRLEDFEKDLAFYRQSVRRIFESVVGGKRSESVVYHWEDPAVERIISSLREEGEEDAEEALHRIMKDAQSCASPSMVIKNLADFLQLMKYTKRTIYELLVENDRFRKTFVSVLGNSQFLSRIIFSDPELVETLFEDPTHTGVGEGELTAWLEERIKDLDAESAKKQLERSVRERLLRIGIADVSGRYNIYRVFAEHTKLAKACIKALDRWLTAKKHAPVMILGLGKLGSKELTYHSDVDVVFFSTKGGDHIHAKYYTSFIDTMPYEVDTRLRPFGSKGVMVVTPEALSDYLKKHGRVWERLAYSRARVIFSDDRELEQKVTQIIDEFVHGQVDDLEREVWNMRLKMEKELGRSPYNLKYSEGAIVDVEFAAQFLAVRHGIKKQNPLGVLRVACNKGILEKKDYVALKEGYHFLRWMENILRLSFYPPLKEFPRRGERLSMLSRMTGLQEHELVDRFMEVKRSNRAVLRKILNV